MNFEEHVPASFEANDRPQDIQEFEDRIYKATTDLEKGRLISQLTTWVEKSESTSDIKAAIKIFRTYSLAPDIFVKKASNRIAVISTKEEAA